jgi:hypothetical protein
MPSGVTALRAYQERKSTSSSVRKCKIYPDLEIITPTFDPVRLSSP